MSDNKPLDTLRDGNLKLTFWLNQSDSGSFISVTPAKTYEDRNGKLQDSQSFSGSDLLRFSELAREGHHRHRELRREFCAVQTQAQAPQQVQQPTLAHTQVEQQQAPVQRQQRTRSRSR